MKRIFTFILFLAVCATACKKDDNNAPTSITGVWNLVSSAYKVTNGTGVIKNESYPASVGDVLKLDDTGTYTSIVDGDVEKGTWKLSADGKTMTLDSGTEYESIMDVVKHTKSELVFSFSEIDGEYIYQTTLNLKR